MLTRGHAPESTPSAAVMDTGRVTPPRGPHDAARAKGYSYSRIRRWLRRRGIEAVIPHRADQPPVKIDKRKYRRRNVIERCIGWLKCCRRIATRYEKLATHFLSMVKLGMIQRCMRILDPSDTT